MSKQVALGIDIGGTNTVYGFIDQDGYIHHHNEIPTNGFLPPIDLIDRLESKIKHFLEDNKNIKLTGIGIGAPNGNHYTGIIQSPPNLSWGNTHITKILMDRFDCKVLLTNDANAAALGEKYYGVAVDLNDFIVITLGTGLGSGIFSGGRLLYGYDGFAGEMGHMPIDTDGRKCNCGNYGCLESYASASGIKTTVEEFLIDNPDNTFLNTIYINNGIDGLVLDEEFDKGNTIARKIYEFTGQKLGIGLAQAAVLLSPEVFIFYGGFSNAGERILKPAKRVMDKHLINSNRDTIKLLRSGLPQGHAGILGAASLIWDY